MNKRYWHRDLFGQYTMYYDDNNMLFFCKDKDKKKKINIKYVYYDLLQQNSWINT